MKLFKILDLVENKAKADWGLSDCVDYKMYYLLDTSPDIAGAYAHARGWAGAQSVRAHKANTLI